MARKGVIKQKTSKLSYFYRMMLLICLITTIFLIKTNLFDIGYDIEINKNLSREVREEICTLDSNSPPKNYTEINHWYESNFTEIEDFTVENDILYAIGEYYFRIYNLSSKNSPELLYQRDYFIEHNPEKIVVKDQLVFISASAPGFYGSLCYSIDVYNSTSPTQPIKITTFVHYYFKDFIIDENFLYLTSTRDGLKVFDILDLHSIAFLSDLQLDNAYNKIVVNDNYLLAVDRYDKFYAINITNKNNLQIVFEQIFVEEVTDFYIEEDSLYITNNSFLTVINIADIKNPLEVAVTQLNLNPYYYGINQLLVKNQRLFISYLYSILIYDISQVESPMFINSIDNSLGYIYKFVLDEDFLYINAYSKIFVIFDLNDIANELLLFKSNIPETNEIALEGELAIVNDALTGVKFFNFSKPETPELLAIYPTTVRIWDVAIENKTAYYIDDSYLVLLNITNPTNPVFISNVTNIGGQRLVVDNNYVYVSNDNRFIIVNATNLGQPEVTDYIVTGKSIRDITIEDDKAAITTAEKCYLLDISDKENIILASQFGEELYMSSFIEIKNKILYMAAYTDGFRAYNITDLESPQLVAYIETSEIGFVRRLYCDDNNLVYLITNKWSMLIYNVSNLDDLTIVGQFQGSGNTYWGYDYDYVGTEDRIYVASEEKGISILGKDSDNDQLADYLENEIYLTDKEDKDSDNDTLWDGYEVEFGFDPNNSSDSLLDLDADTLSNVEEYIIGTDPLKHDTDFDGLLDAEESNYATSPTDIDSDDDRLVDSFEIFIIQTNPLVKDTDNDALDDWEEWITYRTDPNNNDTDQDLISDGYEVKNYLNPLDATDSQKDLDLDGLTNLEEYYLGTYAYNSDTDKDSYTDYEEVEAGTDPLDETDYPDYTKTGPLYPTKESSLTIISGIIKGIICLALFSAAKRKRRREI